MIPKALRLSTFATLAMLLLCGGVATAAGWEQTKNIADDIIYDSVQTTFYCGCTYTSDEDNDGSGDITSTAECRYEGPSSYSSRAGRIEWEHVVPASLMPARHFPCWSGDGGSRERCETSSPRAQAMLFDLHNLVPAIG